MKSLKLLALPLMLLCALGIQSCEKDKSIIDAEHLADDALLSEQWSFSTSDFVSWPDIYDKLIPTVNRAKGNGSQGIRSATEDEADIVNQITASNKMKKELKSITKEIGKPDWSYLMAFKGESIHHRFELFVPLMDKGDMTGTLTFTLQDDGMVMRATKKNSMDHLVRKEVDRSLLDRQVHTISASNIFERINENIHTPVYESWYEEAFSEGYEPVSNAKDVQQSTTYWVTQWRGGVTVTYSEFEVSSTVSCPAPHEVEDPFGSGSIGSGFFDVDITPPRLYTGLPSNLSTTTYIDLSKLENFCTIGKVKDDNGNCVEEYYFDVNGDPVPWCESSFNPVKDKTGSLWITQMALTTSGGVQYTMLRRNQCVSQISIQVPLVTHSGIEISSRITKVLIREAITSATNDLSGDLRFNENTDCDFRSTLLQERINTFLQEIFKDEFNKGPLSTDFRGVEAFVRNEATHSRWVFPDIPWRWLQSEHYLLGCKFTGKDHYN